jgi:hypothetical protein
MDDILLPYSWAPCCLPAVSPGQVRCACSHQLHANGEWSEVKEMEAQTRLPTQQCYHPIPYQNSVAPIISYSPFFIITCVCVDFAEQERMARMPLLFRHGKGRRGIKVVTRLRACSMLEQLPSSLDSIGIYFEAYCWCFDLSPMHGTWLRTKLALWSVTIRRIKVSPTFRHQLEILNKS